MKRKTFEELYREYRALLTAYNILDVGNIHKTKEGREVLMNRIRMFETATPFERIFFAKPDPLEYSHQQGILVITANRVRLQKTPNLP